MNRRLILIANDGGQSNFLPGVSRDINNYISYFMSDEGGAWSKEEIVVVKNADDVTINADWLHQFFLFADVEFILLVFSGHGYSKDGETYLELQPDHDCKVEDIRLWAYNTRCLLIADCCRVPVYGHGGTIPSIQSVITESVQSNYRDACRELYNNAVKEVPIGTFTIGYSASLGETAIDTSKGGLFSANLLDEARKFISFAKISPSSCDTVYSYSFVHTMTARNMPTGHEPSCETPRGNQFPFAVVPKQTKTIEEYAKRAKPLADLLQ